MTPAGETFPTASAVAARLSRRAALIVVISIILAIVVFVVMLKSEAGAKVISAVIGVLTVLMIVGLIAASC